MLPNVSIEIRRDGLGQVAFTNDTIMGLILTGSAVSSTLALNTPYAIYSLKDAENLGIKQYEEPVTAPPVAGANAAAWTQIRDFYKESGDGAKLWIIVGNENKMSTYVTGGGANPCLLEILATKANGEIAVVGVCPGKSQGSTITDGLNDDVWDTIAAAQVVARNYQENIMPFSVVVAGIGFAGDADTAKDLKAMSNHRVSVVLAAPASDNVAGVGQLLGRLAGIPVQRKISRVKDGALGNLTGYLTDGVVVEYREGDLSTLHDKGYIVYRTFQGKSGYFYSGDPTATSATDDLNTISRNRIIDKALKITYNTYIEEIDDEVPITSEGRIEPAVCGALQEKIERQINGNMVNEISDFSAYIDPDQNILSGTPLEVVLDITPKGYLGNIRVSLGFINPFST